MRCPRCGADAVVDLGPAREVTVRTVAGLVEHLPVVRCPAGHRDPATDHAGHATEVLERVHDGIPRGRTRVLRGEVCAYCRSPLTMPVRRTGRAVTVASLPGVPVLTYHFDLPLTRCPRCGTEQLPSRSQEDLAETVGELCVADHRRRRV